MCCWLVICGDFNWYSLYGRRSTLFILWSRPISLDKTLILGLLIITGRETNSTAQCDVTSSWSHLSLPRNSLRSCVNNALVSTVRCVTSLPAKVTPFEILTLVRCCHSPRPMLGQWHRKLSNNVGTAYRWELPGRIPPPPPPPPFPEEFQFCAATDIINVNFLSYLRISRFPRNFIFLFVSQLCLLVRFVHIVDISTIYFKFLLIYFPFFYIWKT